MKFRKSKFTLIELLCSVSIMVILVTLLLVTVQKVRERAQKTMNINNLRQLSYAIQMYTMDHDGAMPYISNDITDSRCLFLVLPYTNNTLKLFYPLVLYDKESGNPEYKKYFDNPNEIIDDIKNNQTDLFPGYAYSSINNQGEPLKEQRMESNDPIIANINGTYQDTVYILYLNGSVIKVNGPRANDSIIAE